MVEKTLEEMRPTRGRNRRQSTKGDRYEKNIGNTERVVRIVAGLIIISLAFVGPQSPWAFLGIIPVLTGVIGWCPPYALLGISTCKDKSCSVPS